MKFTDFFIRRPVFATVVNLLILLGGLSAIKSLNVRQYPRSDLAVINVTTVYVGANADLVRGFLTTPLERVIASADGIDYLESISAQGLSTISVHLKLNYDPNAALTQVQAKVAQVRNDLPPEAQAPVIQILQTDDTIAAAYLSFYSDSLNKSQITDYLTRVVQPKVTAISGVQRADILGAGTFAMRIWLKPDRMAALNLSPTDVRNALAANNYLAAIGATKGSMTSINLIANTDLRSATDFKQLVVRQSNNAIVRLGEIADVELGSESYDTDVRFNGERATFMGVWVLPTANSLDVIKDVRKILPEIRDALPAGLKLDIPYDSTKYIQDALNDVFKTLIETLLIVIVVIFLFLGSIRSVLVPVVAIPISLIGAVGLMLVFGFTLNLLTLLAIVLAVGLVVDDAIVVVENVERHLEAGDTPLNASLKGARELFGPIVAMTLTLAAVYAPIGFQGGLTGALFREFAFTLAGAVAVSGVVAITLSPMMSSKLLRAQTSPRGYAAWINRNFDKLRKGYAHRLKSSLNYRPVAYTLWGLVFLTVVPLAYFSQNELAPKEDQSVVFGIVQAAPNATIDQTVIYTEEALKAFQSFPEGDKFFQLTNPSGGFSGMVTKPWSERKRTTEQMVPEAYGKLGVIPGVRIIATTPQPLPGGSNFPVEFVIATTADPRQLLEFADELTKRAVDSGLFFFADSDLKFDQPQTEIVFDRDKVASLGLNLSQVGADLSTMLGGNYINRFSIQGLSYKVIPELKRVERLNTDQLKDIYVTAPVPAAATTSGPNGASAGTVNQLVPLSTFATLKNTTEPRTLNRFQQLNSAKITGVPKQALGTILSFLNAEAKKILPQGYFIDYGGTSRQQIKEGNKLWASLLFALVIIFLVLAAQFESFRDPLIILIGSVPLALAGALIFSFVGLTTINIYSQVGLITLVGLIAKNAILIVEFANVLQEKGRSKVAAVVESASTRLRPILMTSVATVAGHFPLVIASGPGAGARNSIGIVLVSGMIIGTFFTLFIVPAIYVLLAKDHSHDHLTDPAESEASDEPVREPEYAVY
jgi:multidrug efflux pump